jgi:anti-sigma B factor antagonist
MRSWEPELGPTLVQVEGGRHSELPTLRIVGELDASSADLVREAAGDLRHVPCVAIDLSGLEFMDSAGMGALIASLRTIREAGGRVALVGPRPSVGRVIHAAGFERIVPVVETVADAVEAFTQAEDGVE